MALLLLVPPAGAVAVLISPRRRGTLLGLAVAVRITSFATVIAVSVARSSLAGMEPGHYQPAVTAVEQVSQRRGVP